MQRARALLVVVAAALAAVSSRADGVIINEVHYDPADKTSRLEFVELHNATDSPVDVSGWFFSDGIDWVFPDGSVLAARGYLVVAEDPSALVAAFGPIDAQGPFGGRLSNEEDLLVLRNASGGLEDEVDYQRGFPWPTAGGSAGLSIELLHPGADNAVGGAWRVSDPAAGDATELVAAGAVWRYQKGLEEASTPRSAWRTIGHDVSDWGSGRAPLGYGESIVATSLGDMRGGYTSVFLRREFEVADAAALGSLLLEVLWDDGFNAWINGTHVAGSDVASADLPFDATASGTREDLSFRPFPLSTPQDYLVEGTNVLAIQLFNASLSGSSDAFIDARLVGGAGAGVGPTPGRANAVLTERIPPRIRRVDHFPRQPVSGEVVAITALVTDPDGVAGVELDYAIVEPGSYVRLDDPEYEQGWTTIALADDGEGIDVTAGDGVWSALIPGSVQRHRRLIRYRLRAVDGLGDAVRVPYSDDPQPNFAYFVYDGVPAWRGASRPGETPVVEFDETVMTRLPVYHLIAREPDVIASQYQSSSRGVHFLGTLVYDEKVYDHIEFENRGEFSTYQSGKNKWRFHFNRGHSFEARDDYGSRYRSTWKTMNLSGCASPWVPANRGMAGLDEGVAFPLYELAGVPSPRTHFFHFRVIDEAVEAHGTDQYRGDLWGLYLAIEHTDGRFLEERRLPDGNVYKIEGGGGDKRNQGPTQSTSSSDYEALKAGYNSSQPISWWRANVELERYYSFRAINTAINNMDLREGWNMCQYHDPETDRWTAIPWDLDMLWMPVTHWSGVMNFQNALSQHATLLNEYRNRSRELQDLLINSDQFAQLVAERWGVVTPGAGEIGFAEVDEAMWNLHPRTTSAHRGWFYRNPANHSARGGTITRTLQSADHLGQALWVVDFATTFYGADRLESHARDTAIPETPQVAYVGSAGFPIDGLEFSTSAFADPQGAGSFGALEWRLARISPVGDLPFDPEERKRYEIDADWESGEITPFESRVRIPAEEARPGATYRVRARMKDSTERWSHWSAPVTFVAGTPSEPPPAQRSLRITELHYHPAGDGDLEFVELRNVGPEPIDLRSVSFSEGIDFDFDDGVIPELEPGAFVLVVSNLRAFELVHGADLPVAGEYSGRLANGGERVELEWGKGVTILDFVYGDDWYPETDGLGWSLHIVDDLRDPATWSDPASWAPSVDVGGSPGRAEPVGPAGGARLPGDVNSDARLDVSDAVALLRRLFLATAAPLPCEGDISSPGNLLVLDYDGDESVVVTDAVALLDHLFRGGPPPAAGTSCVRVEGCVTVCGG